MSALRKPVSLLFLLLLSAPAAAAPLKSDMASQKIAIRATRIKGTARFVQEGLKIRPLPDAITWQYLPETSVSIPYMKIEILGIPPSQPPLTALIEKVGQLEPDEKGRYIMTMPMLETSNRVSLTLINIRGQLEEWEIVINIALQESAIYVDETCTEYMLKIRELRRPDEPNFIFIGCKAGTRPHHVSLDVFWKNAARLKFREQVIGVQSSIASLPLEYRYRSVEKLMGQDSRKQLSTYEITYDPVVPKPYEVWAGAAFFRTAFSQSNFASSFSQISTAFMAKAWYRPEDVRLSVMARGFGSLLAFSNSLTPPTSGEESVSTYFLSTELRYKLIDHPRWRFSPFFGGWFYFMRVKSRQFGLQRIITPIIGAAGEYQFTRRDRAELALRFVPLQSFVNPLEFTLDEAYLEAEASFVHELLRGGRIFGTLYYGRLKYAPPDRAITTGSYLVFGGGYGW